MRIALAQINTTVADFDGNLRKVREALDEARRRQVDLVVFPEQTIPGYPAEDLLERGDFIDRVEATFHQAVALADGVAMVIGTVCRAAGSGGNPIHNSAALVADRQVLLVQHKTLLPTYDVFDEGRYFRPAERQEAVDFRGRRIGLAICEDLWNDPLFWSKRRYPRDPVQELVRCGADLVVSVSASPFNLGRRRFRRQLLENTVNRFGVDLVYSNLVGGNTSLVFDGGSVAFDAAGKQLVEAASFREDFVSFDLGLPAGRATVGERSVGTTRAPALEPPGAPVPEEDVEDAFHALVLGTRDYLGKSGFKSAVVGLSGGIDSAVTAAVAVEAIGAANVLGVSMPSRYSSEGSVRDAECLAGCLGIELRQLSIEKIFAAALDTLAPVFAGLPEDVTEENIQARIRGMLLMALSNKTGALLLTTGNKSELAVGYCTLYGDMSGGLAVISDVPKTLVYRLARWLNRDREVIPWSSIEKPPSAELRPEQTDQDSLPPYDVLDTILEAYVEDHLSVAEMVALGLPQDVAERTVGMVDRNEYKRKQAAPGLRITAKAFGSGRRMPIVRK